MSCGPGAGVETGCARADSGVMNTNDASAGYDAGLSIVQDAAMSSTAIAGQTNADAEVTCDERNDR